MVSFSTDFPAMEITKTIEDQNPPHKTFKSFVIWQTLLRTLEIGAMLITISLMVTTKQTVDLLGFQTVITYSYAPALKFSLVVTAVSCVISTLSLIFVLITAKSPSPNYFTLFLTDFVATVVVLPGTGAAFTIGYLAKYGYKGTLWLPTCGLMPKFCKGLEKAMMVSVVGVLLSVFLTVWSAYRLAKQPASS